ncbi:MAG: hypothetical protein HOW73_41345 [Polyangiaceae bacterium]|nr:hypothetical protein [Polyangiaceae bacterium]
MSARNVSGMVMLGVGRYIEEELDPARRDRLHSKGQMVERANIKQDAWYPLQPFANICRSLDELYDDPQEGFQAVRRAGKCIAEDGASTYLRLLMKVLTPKLFIRQFPGLWKRYHDFGELTIDMQDIDKNRVVAIMPAYPCVYGLAAGWIEFAFAAFKAKADLKCDYPWRGETPDPFRFTLTWTS